MEDINISGNKNIVLTGFMGSGKTTLGKYIANNLNMKYADTDESIKRFLESSISEVFDKKGEEYFRDIEHQICEKLSPLDGYIISTGGGTLLYEWNLNLFIRKSLIIFVNTPFEICYQRIINTDRPIATKKTKQELKEMYDMRVNTYKDISHISMSGTVNINL